MGPEKTFETKVKKFIEDQNCWFVKFFANRMTKKGIPDILPTHLCRAISFLGVVKGRSFFKRTPLKALVI